MMRPWVILFRNQNGLEQMGPLETEAVYEGLHSGKFKYSDHVWKQGLKGWTRIGDLGDFQSVTPLDSETFEKELDSNIQIDLDNVVRQVRRSIPTYDWTSAEANSKGNPVDFIERPELQARVRLNHKVRRSRPLWPALVVFFGIILTLLGVRHFYPKKSIEPVLQVKAGPVQKVVPIAAPEVDMKQKQKLAALFRHFAGKAKQLEELNDHLRDDPSAWQLSYSDWKQSLEGSEQFRTIAPGRLKTLVDALLKRGQILNETRTASSAEISNQLLKEAENLDSH